MADDTLTMLAPDGKVRVVPSAQKDAALKAGGKSVVKMLDPSGTARWVPEDQKDAALKAGGKLATASTPPARPASPVSPSDDLTANPNGEGVYSLHKGGQTVNIPYSKVQTARDQGYRFADQKAIEKYGADFADDPANKGKVQTWEEQHPVLGFIPKTLQGAGGSLEEGLAGADRLVSHLSGEQPIESLQLEAAKHGPDAGVPEAIGGLGEQLAEFMVGEGEARAAVKGTELASQAGKLTARAKEATEFLNKFPRIKALVGLGAKSATEAAKAAAEQGGMAYVRSGGDVEQAKEAAKAGAVAGAAVPVASTALEKGNLFIKNVLRHHLGVDEYETGQLIKATEKANENIDADAKRVYDANKKAANAANDTGNKADAARLEHDSMIVKRDALQAKQQNLSDALERTRAVVRQRLTNLKSAARSYFNKAYGELESTGKGKQVQLLDLTEDMNDALEHVKGSEESTRTFKDIAKRAQGVAGVGQIPAGYTEEDWAALAPDEREAIRADIREKTGGGAGVSLEDLDGYYSELGRVAASKSTPGDLKAAAEAMRESINRRIKETYGEGVMAKINDLRAKYRTFARGFLDSDSPVAQSIEARDDYHGTQHFTNDTGRKPAVKADVRDTIVGDPGNPSTQFFDKNIAGKHTRGEGGTWTAEGKNTPAWRYRKETHQAVEHLRNLETGLSKTSKAASDAAKDVEDNAGKLETLRAKAREAIGGFEMKPPPTLKTLTPAELQKAKEEVYGNFAHNLGKFGKWVVIGGITGGAGAFVSALLSGQDISKGLKEAGAGFAMGLFMPHMISKLLEQPGVIESLTKTTKGDLQKLMAMPPEQRGPTEDLIRMMSQQALDEGRIKSAPWLRILAGTAARNVAAPQSTTGSTESTEQMLHEIEQMQNEPAGAQP